ncbi:hypothetical protein CQW23_33727 [Capsicum baccatum]|uniref:Protein TAR1 n=1 Tax=Capsicum baccatum TaxID=33114 RepID=A0A2G2V107_CAPBA|nr:hypothetical protein CQW23_33727 [Capsicum baccatum]
MHGRRPPALAADWTRPHACSAWSLPREQHPILAARTKVPPRPKSSASSPVVDDTTDNRQERTMKRGRRCYTGTNASHGLAMHAAMRPRSHASLEKQEANSCEVSSEHLVGFFKDGCTNLLWRRAARWLDWMGRNEPERQRAESQWIVAARPLCHLQYPVAYLSHLQRILPAARWKLYFNCTLRRPPRPFRRGGLANDTCPWGPRPLLRVGKRTAGACVASSPDSDLEAFSHNPAHGSFAPLAFQPSAMTNCVNQRFLSYKWVNNPTLGEFCFTMIGRADIKGSKSNVAMNAWLPQASYPCDVPPQPNSQPDNVFRPDQPAVRALGLKRGAVPRFRFTEKIPLARTSSELAVQCAGRISRSPLTAYVFGTGTPVPSPQSQSFSRSYGSILPTSLAYIVPSTRGCSPWRPDAVMSTTGRGRHSVLRIFKVRRERNGHHATCGSLPAAGPYLWLSRFLGGQAVKQKRKLFPRLPPMSPDFLTLPLTVTSRSRQVCSHSNPSKKIKVGWRCTPRGDPTNQLRCALWVYSPVDSHTCQTPWSVFEEGSNGEPTGHRLERADVEERQSRALPATIEEMAFHKRIESPGFGRPSNPRWSTPRVDQRTGSSPFYILLGAHRKPPSASLPTISSTL